MTSPKTIPMASNALPADNENQREGNGLHAPHPRSKSELLAALMSKPETYEMIGSAWRIFVLLLTVENGIMMTTYAEAGGKVGVGEKTMRNWICDLEHRGIISKKNKGHGVKISLCEPYLQIAQASDYVVKETEAIAPEDIDDPQIRALRDIGRIARSRGSSVEIKMVI